MSTTTVRTSPTTDATTPTLEELRQLATIAELEPLWLDAQVLDPAEPAWRDLTVRAHVTTTRMLVTGQLPPTLHVRADATAAELRSTIAAAWRHVRGGR